jgi:hypothetical protein
LLAGVESIETTDLGAKRDGSDQSDAFLFLQLRDQAVVLGEQLELDFGGANLLVELVEARQLTAPAD